MRDAIDEKILVKGHFGHHNRLDAVKIQGIKEEAMAPAGFRTWVNLVNNATNVIQHHEVDVETLQGLVEKFAIGANTKWWSDLFRLRAYYFTSPLRGRQLWRAQLT